MNIRPDKIWRLYPEVHPLTSPQKGRNFVQTMRAEVAIAPADIYRDVLRLLPAHELYEPLNIKEWANAAGVSARDRCYLPEIVERMDTPRTSFWHQVWLALTAESQQLVVFRKLKKDIALRLGVHDGDVDKADASVHLL